MALSETTSEANGPIIIKKYANRRLYNTQTSSYVTLDHLCEMVKKGVEFEVRDARTGDDITRSVLAPATMTTSAMEISLEAAGTSNRAMPLRRSTRLMLQRRNQPLQGCSAVQYGI